MINFLTTELSSNAVETVCGDGAAIIQLVGKIVSIFQIVIPIILVVLGLIQLGKAVVSSKDDEVKKATSGLIKKIVYAAAIFFVVAIVKIVVGLVSTGDMKKCWELIENPWGSVSSQTTNG